RYDIVNGGAIPVAPTAYYRLLRDSQAPEGEGRFAHTYTGPAVYTSEHKFQKVSFEDLAKGKGDYAKTTNDGWVAMLQHYFMSAWILKPLDGKSVCKDERSCRFELTQSNGLNSAAALVDYAAIAPGKRLSVNVPLYAGPEEYDLISKVADGMEYAKDFGMFYIFASPLFWLLVKLHGLVSNWGWAIILLTLTVKAAFYPLTAASYRSMAKMKALAPRLERMKEQYGDDRMKFQQAVME
ncbi:membrane protein insertase YidC, partial [Pseudomonas sp. MWU13-2860]